MKAAMQATPTTVWHVIFEPGTIQYTNNRWLWGVNQVIIDAYGVTFQDTITSIDIPTDAEPFWNGEFFMTGGDVLAVDQTYADGFLINTAAAGATSVTTSTAANAGAV